MFEITYKENALPSALIQRDKAVYDFTFEKYYQIYHRPRRDTVEYICYDSRTNRGSRILERKVPLVQEEHIHINHHLLSSATVLPSKNFFNAIHKTVESRPEPYGLFHLAFVVLSLLVIAAVCYLLRKSSDKTFRTVLLTVGAALLLSEVFKQLYYFFAVNGEGYDWYIFPFQLCSVPMYLSVAVGCMRKCVARDALCEYMASISFLGGIMAYAEPSGILNGHYFTLIHSCIWHALLIFIALYVIVTNNACRSLKDYKKALAVLGGVVATATVLNVVFRSKPDFNMCYISPFYNTPLAVFSSFDAFFQGLLGQFPGRILSILIYVIALALGGLIVFGVSYAAKRRSPVVQRKSGIK